MGGQVDLSYLMRRAASSFPDQIAILDGETVLSMRAMVRQAERFANALEGLGVAPGTRVALLSENRWEYVVADLALILGRYVRVALNARLDIGNHEQVLADAGVGVLIHSAGFAPEAIVLRDRLGVRTICFDADGSGAHFSALAESASDRPVTRRGENEDAAWITYTAGTTGKPKGVVLSRRAIREVAFNLLLELGPVAPGGRIMLPQALSHGAGYFTLPWLLSGAGVRIFRSFDPAEVVTIGAAEPGSLFKCVPAMLSPIIAESRSCDPRFGSIVYGASPISRAVLEASLDRFGPILTQIYGQSEAPATLTCLKPADHLGSGDERFSAGRPWRSVAIEIRDADGRALPPGEAGEVVISGPHMMTGYHGLPERTAEVMRNGWIATRDRGVIDERGFVHLRGRMDDMIISGGYNIAPKEVEDALCGLAAIEDVSVIGIPDARWGTAVAAAVTLKPGAAQTIDQVIAFAKPLLGFRAPKVVRIVEAIPRTPYGKVDRTALTALLSDEQEQAA